MTPRTLLLTLGLALAAGSASADDDIIAAWVQYTVDGVEARAVSESGCPTLLIDGQSAGMYERAAPTGDHPNWVCARELAEGVRSVELDGRSLPVPVRRPRRIVVMGDTGCRLSDGLGFYQECNNDSLWPFRYVAQSAAAAKPDLIIYMGDYIYRESACPTGNNGCKDSPFGDQQLTWEEEWLLPAAPVHGAAPLVLVRGNHESCNRAGHGWFRYLSPRTPAVDCETSTDPWIVTLDSMQIAVMDVATIDGMTDRFADQLAWIDGQLTKPAWIASHRTFWGFGADDHTGDLATPTLELQDAVRDAGMPSLVRLLVGAHIHLAEVLDFGGKRPPQLVVANSGTQLVPRVDPPSEIDGVAIRDMEVIYQYGFVTMDRRGRHNWRIRFRDLEGRKLEQCKLQGSRVRCK